MKYFWLAPVIWLFSCTNFDPRINAGYPQASNQLDQAIRLLKEYKTDSAELVLNTLASSLTLEQNPDMYIQASIHLGKLYSDRGKNVEALAFYQQALKSAEASEDQPTIAIIYKNIGVLYVQWKKFDKALQYYDLAENTAKIIGNEELLADCENNKGIIFEQQQQYDKALAAYQQALNLYETKQLPSKMAMAYSNMAIVYKLQQNFDQSILFNLKAIELLEQMQDKWSLAATYNNIGNLYGQLGRYQQAIEFCNRSLKIAREIEAEEIIGMAYESMAHAAASANDHESAYQYHLKYSESMNKFINEESTRQLTEMTVRYETEQKENALAKIQLASQRKNIWLIGLTAAVGIGLVLVRNITAKAKFKTTQLELENKLLLQRAHTDLQEQRLAISRDLHDSVGAQLTFIHSISNGLLHTEKSLESSVQEKLRRLGSFSSNAISELRNTLWVLTSKEITLNDLKSKLLNFVHSAAEADESIQFETDIELADNRQLPSQLAIHLFRTVQETINNAVKYAGASIITLRMKQENDLLTLVVQDNGKGFDTAAVQQSSYGLRNMFSRLEESGGKLTLDSGLGSGTTCRIEISI
jgi:two-component system NarL family sensor kinase